MATGMAIMGFGGGAMIGAPLADLLMNHFRTPDFGRRVADLRRHGGDLLRLHDGRRLRLPRCRRRAGSPRAGRRRADANAMITHAPRASAERAQDAAVLAAVGGAVPERQRRHRRHRHGLADAAGDFRRPLIGHARRQIHRSSTDEQQRTIAAIAAGFTGLLSLFNIGGRFFWASLSD